MRVKEPFTLIKRTLPSGKKVWYYRYYDKNNVRTPARSTGETSKAVAYDKIFKLYKQGRLQTSRSDVPTFEQFATDFWDWEKSPFLQAERNMGTKRSQRRCSAQQGIVKKHFLPCLKDKRLDMIITKDIQELMKQLKDKGLSNASINMDISSNLSIIFGEAVRLGYIDKNPVKDVMKYENDTRAKGILSISEVMTLFSDKVKWESLLHKTANELAACTGMRIGEILALKGKHIKLECVEIAENWQGTKYGSGKTKTKTVKSLPIPSQLMDKLHAMKYADEEKFIFSDDGKIPFTPHVLRMSFYNALKQIGIDKAKRLERNITFHSWRHYVASRLATMNVSTEKRMKVTGHTSEQMLEHYTHLGADSLKDILVVTSEIYEDKKNAPAKADAIDVRERQTFCK